MKASHTILGGGGGCVFLGLRSCIRDIQMEGKRENEIVRPEGVLTCLVWQSHLQMYPSQRPRLLSQSERAEPDGAGIEKLRAS